MAPLSGRCVNTVALFSLEGEHKRLPKMRRLTFGGGLCLLGVNVWTDIPDCQAICLTASPVDGLNCVLFISLPKNLNVRTWLAGLLRMDLIDEYVVKGHMHMCTVAGHVQTEPGV